MTWSQGDFTYDGVIGPAELSKLLTNYGKSGPLNIGNIPALAFDALTSDVQAMQLLGGHDITISEVTTVPEPSSVAMLASLVARRRAAFRLLPGESGAPAVGGSSRRRNGGFAAGAGSGAIGKRMACCYDGEAWCRGPRCIGPALRFCRHQQRSLA